MTPQEIDTLIERDDWFPFIETWSPKDAAAMFASLVESPFGSSIQRIPKIRMGFRREDFKMNIPDRFRKCYPPMEDQAIMTHDVDNADLKAMNGISDFYMEDLRLSASKRKFKTQTPIEIWDREKKHILALAREKYGPNAGPYEIRNTVFSYTQESNPFRPSIALAVYCIFNARAILDMSAGWGDRLIGALAWAARNPTESIRYQGYDPFAELQPRYTAMISDFAVNKNSWFAVTCSPFEDEPLEVGKFDLAFTSPPYFDFEEYGIGGAKGRGDQSTERYRGVSAWVDGFLIPTMKRAAISLKIGGHLALNIEGPYMYALLDHSMSPNGVFGAPTLKMRYEGIIAYRSDDINDTRAHPIFVWRRLA